MSTDLDILDAAFSKDQPWEAEVLDHEPPPPSGAAGLPSLFDVVEEPKNPAFDGLPRPASTNKWDPRFVLDLALGLDELDTILTRYGLTEQEFELLSTIPAFRRELALTIRDARENGVTFAGKARTQAEGYLEVLDALVYDSGTPASTRLEAIRSTVKWAKLEPRDDKNDGNQNNQQINISINF